MVVPIKPAIVVPVYKFPLDKSEELSWKTLLNKLPNYPLIILRPRGLELPDWMVCRSSEVVSLDSGWFVSTKSYSHLLLKSFFYEMFRGWSHILIYQLDCLVFRDELIKWCAMEWDYVGAPWFFENGGNIAGGNGGLSLRRVSSFLRVLGMPSVKRLSKNEKSWGHIPATAHSAEAKRGDQDKNNFLLRIMSYAKILPSVENQAARYRHNEDVFWSFEAMRYDPEFRVPPGEISLKFSFEQNPSRCYEINGNQLPFGCHAWERYEKEFWNQIMNK